MHDVSSEHSFKRCYGKNLDLEKTFVVEVPKQVPPTGVFRKRCSENMQQIYRRALIPRSDFNKFAKQLY